MAQRRRSGRSSRRERKPRGGQQAFAPVLPNRRKRPGARSIPKHIIIAGAALLALIAAVMAVNWWFAVKQPADKPVLEVNDRVFRWSEYVALLRFQKLAAEHLGGRFQAGSEPYTLMQIMTENELISQAAAREGLRVQEDALKKEMASRLVPGADRITDMAQRDRELELRLGTYLAAVRLTRSQYEEIVGADILRRQLRDKLGQAIPRVQPQAYVHLVVAPTNQSDTVQTQFKEKVPFETIARRFSQEPNVQTNGGDIGWVPRTAFPELDKNLFGWDIGDAEPIETPQGSWLVRVVERMEGAARMEGILLGNINDLDTVQRRVRAGENFPDLAAQFSIDAATRDKRGDMGIVKVGERGPEFDEAIRGIEPGKLFGPVLTHEIAYFGKVTERTGAGEVSSQYFEVLKQRALEDWLNKERAANRINYCPGGPDNCFGSVKVDNALKEISSISLTKAQEDATATALAPARGQSPFGP